MIGRRRGRRTPRHGRTPPAIDVRGLATEHLADGDPVGWFDVLYRRADRWAQSIPWVRGTAHPYLTDWLAEPVASPPGRRAVVVGCGIGDDAVAVAGQGYEVVAFDVSEEAIRWARERFPTAEVDWRVLDLLALPDALVQAFDLVVEVRTVQSLPGVVRDAAMHAIGSLAAPGGVVVAVTLLATDAERARAWTGPPWAQAPSELATYRAAGLERLALEHPDPAGQEAMEVRVTFRRSPGPAPDVLGGPGGAGAGLPVVR